RFAIYATVVSPTANNRDATLRWFDIVRVIGRAKFIAQEQQQERAAMPAMLMLFFPITVAAPVAAFTDRKSPVAVPPNRRQQSMASPYTAVRPVAPITVAAPVLRLTRARTTPP